MRHGFTLIELLTVIGILAVLAAILIPVSGIVMQKKKEMHCRTNLQQIGMAIHAYQTDFSEQFPVTLNALFADGAPLAGESRSVLTCPFDDSQGMELYKGRPEGWRQHFDGPREAGSSYYYEFNGRAMGNSADDLSVLDYCYLNESPRPPTSTTWAKAKSHYLATGNGSVDHPDDRGHPFREAEFPMIRCWFHYAWTIADDNSESLPRVVNLAYDQSVIVNVPWWEKQSSRAP